MSNGNLEDLKKYKREQKKKEIRKKISKVIVESERTLHKGKKIIIVVVIPALEVLANLLRLLDEEDDRNDNDWY